MLYFHLYETIFFFTCFSNRIVFMPNIARAMKKMTVNELGDFIFENYYKRQMLFFNETFEKKRSVVSCNQINSKNS